MRLDFRIDFGYQYLYSRRHYHATYLWDGELVVEDGEILKTYQLDYPVIWYGPGLCAKETALPAPKWKIRTKRGLAGVRFEAEVNDNTVFRLKTTSFEACFRASDIMEKGRLDYAVGPKYVNCSVIVTKTDYLWFREKLMENEVEYDSTKLGLPVHHWARMKLAWLNHGASVKWEYNVKEKEKDYLETLIHIVAMAVPEFSAEKETQVSDYIPLEILCDGKVVCSFKRYYRQHDFFMQILEDEWRRISVPSGPHVFELKNNHKSLCLGISRITMKPCEYMHGQLSIPKWALKNEAMIGKVFAAYDDVIKLCEPAMELSCQKGWNEFSFAFSECGIRKVMTENDCAEIEILDCEEEKYPIKVGYDMTTVPHDDSGFMDDLLDYTYRTRLGNYIVFRNFHPPAGEKNWQRYGEFCLRHHIYVSSCTEYQNGVLAKASGKMFHDCGLHEYPGAVYAQDPKAPYASDNMKEASEKYIRFLKKELDNIHRVSHTAAFGDASGGIRYSFLAGADFVRAETMVPHTMSLLSQTRPAAEAIGKGRWGVHIAIQHGQQPYHETHLGQYFLALMQPWAMGAEVIYEEDSLFNLFKEERQAWDDLLTKGKRNMTRCFYKFAKTHPRRGKNKRNIAFLEGRYAAPFNGFICDSEQDPHYSVWGAFGNDASEWGHGQPEKCRQILDVLMPGASTHPLRQKIEKRRFYFLGTPYGDFDCVPAEASEEYFENYKLILNLGWNTALNTDCDKLKSYVKAGGVLLTGLPQFSTHIKRDFLKDMEDLAFIYDGDLTGLCGIKVMGKGSVYSGQWNAKDREKMTESDLSAMPNDFEGEDGAGHLANVELAGAEVIAWDSASGEPMLVRKKLGKGYVYTFTLWAYPGHEKFQRFCATWVEKLAKETLREISVEDASREVFWTVWETNDEKIMMFLNTDWTEKGNIKNIRLTVGDKSKNIDIKERMLTVACAAKNGTLHIKEFSLDSE